jgi:uncharacterized transporter YbjL
MKKNVRKIVGYSMMIFAALLCSVSVMFLCVKVSKNNIKKDAENKRIYYAEKKEKMEKCQQETTAVICQLGQYCYCTCSDIIMGMKESCILTSINEEEFSFKTSSYNSPIMFPITAKIINVYGIEFEVLNIWKDSIGIKRLYKKEG